MTRYSSDNEISEASVTCHECGGVQDIHCIEWPPKVFVCVYCERQYEYEKTDQKTGAVTWILVVPEHYD